MTDDIRLEVQVTVKQILAKLEILRNFLIVADQGLRQQQSAAWDEAIGVMRDVSCEVTKLLRKVEK